MLFSILFGFWAASLVAFNGDVCRNLAAQFLSLTKKQRATVPLMLGHAPPMGTPLLWRKNGQRESVNSIAELHSTIRPSIVSLTCDSTKTLAYTRLASVFSLVASWFSCGSAADAQEPVRMRERLSSWLISSRHWYSASPLSSLRQLLAANAQLDEVAALADEKGAALWKADGMMNHGCVSALTGKASLAIQMITTGLSAWRSTGATIRVPEDTSYLASAYADVDHFDDARHRVGEATIALEEANERWIEAEVHRLAGEIALKSPRPDPAEAQACFDRALAVARQQQAKSGELRAAMSLARLWRDQGKVRQARELLIPVYGWFTEGFDTLDLKEAKALLGQLEK